MFYSLIITFFLVENTAHSQTPTTIKTPTNVSINALIRPELSPFDFAVAESDAAGWVSTYAPSASRVGPASRTYNCHAYAWHVKNIIPLI